MRATVFPMSEHRPQKNILTISRFVDETLGLEHAMNAIRFFAFSLSMAAVSAALGQSLNLDLETSGGFYETGWGIPSKKFAGAGVAGYWNRFTPGASPVAIPLRGLDGFWTTATIVAPFNSTGGSRLNHNTGDYRSLLNDSADINTKKSIDLAGLESGMYKVVIYSTSRTTTLGNPFTPSQVYVHGSITPNPQVCTGPMPGNQLIEGITHTVHVVDVVEGSLVVTIEKLNGQPTVQFNGLQLVKLSAPRPPSLLALIRGAFVSPAHDVVD